MVSRWDRLMALDRDMLFSFLYVFLSRNTLIHACGKDELWLSNIFSGAPAAFGVGGSEGEEERKESRVCVIVKGEGVM